jgi:hypothetical protein
MMPNEKNASADPAAELVTLANEIISLLPPPQQFAAWCVQARPAPAVGGIAALHSNQAKGAAGTPVPAREPDKIVRAGARVTGKPPAGSDAEPQLRPPNAKLTAEILAWATEVQKADLASKLEELQKLLPAAKETKDTTALAELNLAGVTPLLTAGFGLLGSGWLKDASNYKQAVSGTNEGLAGLRNEQAAATNRIKGGG